MLLYKMASLFIKKLMKELNKEIEPHSLIAQHGYQHIFLIDAFIPHMVMRTLLFYNLKDIYRT